MAYSDEMKIFAGTASSSLSERICAHLGTACGNAAVTHFEDGEIRVQFQENIRGKDVFLVNSTSPPVNDHLIEAAGADRVLTVDLHCDQIQGFFDIPVDHLSSEIAFTRHFRQLRPSEDLVVVSPDTGSVHRIRRFANRLEAPLAIVDKRRPKANVSEVMNLIGEVKDRHALIFDDLIDTGGTLVKAAEAIKARGAIDVTACATHAVFSGKAVDRIYNSVLEEVWVSDSIPLSEEAAACPKIKVLSIAPLIGEGIRRIHAEESLSILFE